MKIRSVKAYPISFAVDPSNSVTLGIGRTVKRDAVIVKVTTESGLVGYGESHHGRSHTAIAQIINSTLSQLVIGMEASDVVGIWARIYKFQLGSHGMGAATAMAMSGLDMALWDIRGKAVDWPLYRLLGGASRGIPAYAGGIALGYQDPASLVEETERMVAQGYSAVKLRVGDTPNRDIARVSAVRLAFPDLDILTDANTNYTLADARKVLPAFDEQMVGWLEEPFPSHDYRSYQTAAGYGRTPLAAGENHYTRFEFNHLLEHRAVQIFQPDLSKVGGLTEGLRVAAMASAYKIPVNPHTSATGLNMAATIHFLAAIDNPGYFEGDVSVGNRFRDELGSKPYELNKDGTVRPLEAPGLGIEIDEAFLSECPCIEGPGYI